MICLGKVVGNLPEGFTKPVNISKRASPYSWPAYQDCKIDLALLTQGISTGEPVFRTIIALGLISKTFSISVFCSPGKLKSTLSFPSVSQSELVPTKRITSSTSLAMFKASSSKSILSGG